ncbi:MAG: glycosyltransferase family 2 protein [Actinomycetota bacterium]|nr:glycosyltransferase family 2 protein [Actinomycetota bacterium]
MPTNVPEVDVVVLTHGDEPFIGAALDSVLASEGIRAHIWLVDNGNTTDALDARENDERVTVLQPGRNLGFAGGVNFGAAQGSGATLAVLNADARADPRALEKLVAVAAEPEVGIAAASLRLPGARAVLNSAGNPLHISGLSWAGDNGRPADERDSRRAAPIASGAAFAIRRRRWEELGGFWAPYFTYHEDTDLSLRCWQRGWRVDYVPDAVVEHAYEFARNPRKLAHVERNRLVILLTLFQARTLLLLTPVLLLTEAAVCGWALAGGWLGAKVSGWAWIWRHRRDLAARRASVQRQRRCSDRELAWLLTARLDDAVVAVPAGLLRVVNPTLHAYWRLVRRWL